MRICLCQRSLNRSAVDRCSCSLPWKEQTAPTNVGTARPGSICTHGIRKVWASVLDHLKIYVAMSPPPKLLAFSLVSLMPIHHMSQEVCKLYSGYGSEIPS